MRLERILEVVYTKPWAILPARHAAITKIIEAHLDKKALFDLPDTDPDEEDNELEVAGRVAIIPIEGTILNKCSGLEAMCGAFSLQDFKADLRAAAARQDVETIILNISSGGGTITGVPEAADLIAELAQVKPIYAYTDDCIASAAYWLASQTRGIFLSKSAEIGSIGVYCALIDSSRAFEAAGLKLELFKAGKYKAMGIDGKTLSDEERALIQAGVDKAYVEFKGYVTGNRKGIKDETMQGQMFSSEEAVSNGLADGIINDLDSLIDYLNVP